MRHAPKILCWLYSSPLNFRRCCALFRVLIDKPVNSARLTTPRLAEKSIAVSLFYIIFGLLGYIPVSYAVMGGDSHFIEYLTQQKNNLTRAINQSKQTSLPIDEGQYKQRIKKNQALITLNQANSSSLASFLINQQTIQSDFSERIKQLQRTDRGDLKPANSQQTINKINTLNSIHKKIITLVEENLNLSQRYQEILLAESRSLELWHAQQVLHRQLEQSHAEQDHLNDLLNTFYDRSVKLQQQMKAQTEFNALYLLEAKLLFNNQLINFTQNKITELILQRKLAHADFLLLKSPDIRTLQTITGVYQDAINQFGGMEQAFKTIISILKKESRYIHNEALNNAFVNLESVVRVKVATVSILEQTLQEDLETHQAALKKQLAVRQSLSEYRMDSWPEILAQISDIPNQLYHYLKNLLFKLYDNYQWLDVWPTLFMGLLVGIVAFFTLVLNQLFKKMTRDIARSRLSGHIYDGVLILLSNNVIPLGLILSVLILFYFNHILFVNYQLLLNLSFVLLTFRSLIILARFVLLERVSDDETGHDVHLYLRIKWLLLVGAWTTAFMVLSHLLPLSLLLQDLFNRFFMLFLVAVSLVSWRSREVITHLLHPVLKNKKRYLQRAVIMLIILVPMTLFTTAIIGLVGYMNLAWTMSSYQMELLLLLAFYVLCRGLMFDALELLSEWMVASLSHGWLWIEVILKPMDKILRLLIVIFSLYVLFDLFGWDSHSWVVTNLIQFYDYPLVHVSGIHISPASVIKFFALVFIFIWASKWTREFCYRWLYRDASDHGIRNSLAVFTQYGVIIVGAFTTLHVLGFEFGGLSMVIGGLAVGMGFGLRDFASNIVGGLMLLIERPVREGDLITIDNYEGKVAHIGIRSMRVCSWDNMEVLIPNAETFNKPFTNWTHQDSIVRTVIPIKISRMDDPSLVQQLVFDVLGIIPEILNEPPSQVFLMKIDEALIEFEVRYFINVATHSRVETRSKVLFAIMAQFKAAGIKPPIPPIEVDLKESQSDFSVFKKPSQE